MDKLKLMQVAALLTNAAAQGIGTGLPVDPTLQDATTRNKDLEVWEIFRVFYAAVSGAVADDKSWPPPAITAKPALPSNLASALAQAGVTAALTANPALAPVVAALQGLINLPAAPATPAAQIPNPGATVPGPATSTKA